MEPSKASLSDCGVTRVKPVLLALGIPRDLCPASNVTRQAFLPCLARPLFAKMVYDWEDKQETCYRMYVVERRSLDDVMKFFKDEGSLSICSSSPAFLRDDTFGRP